MSTRFVPLVAEPAEPSGPAWWFAFQGYRLLVEVRGEDFTVPCTTALDALGLAPLRIQYLGLLDGRDCYACELAEGVAAPSSMAWKGLRSLFGRLDETLLAVAGRAVQIVDWERSHQYCGRCGTPTQPVPGERVRVCPACGQRAYPRIAPAVMVLVTRGDELLLARSPHFTPGVYSALAGFVEPGESLEQTVIREVGEEVGVEVANIRYFGSQPWPFPHSLMIAFTAEHAGGEIAPQASEIEDARWFRTDGLPDLPGRMSISRWLIDAAVERIERSRRG